MPRYFFNVLDRSMSRDDIGIEYADVYAAQAEAVRTSGQMFQDVAESICDGSDWRMEVTDDRGRVLFVVRVDIEDRCDINRNESFRLS